MSGWIKVEKSLENDPRVVRMASRLRNADVTLAKVASVLVVGALVRFWFYADTHIRNDNTLDLGSTELDELVGLPGFCDLLPEDWLRKIDENTVELPDFQQHNGVEAKKRAVTQKRVQRHRNATVTPSALPDQDQTKTKTTKSGGENSEIVLHASLPTQRWEEWLTHRREKRMPMDARTLRTQLKLLAKFPAATQTEIIDASINAGWQGLFAPRVNGKHQPPKDNYANAQ